VSCRCKEKEKYEGAKDSDVPSADAFIHKSALFVYSTPGLAADFPLTTMTSPQHSSDTASQIKHQDDVYSDSEKDVAIDSHLMKRAQWKVDMVIIPIVGMYCEY
jgi:hypothetical protein